MQLIANGCEVNGPLFLVISSSLRKAIVRLEMEEEWYDSSTREQESCSGKEARYKKIAVTASGLGFEARVGEVPKMPQAQPK